MTPSIKFIEVKSFFLISSIFYQVQTDLEDQNRRGKSVTDLATMLLVYMIETRKKVQDVEETTIEDRKRFRKEFEKSMQSFRDESRDQYREESRQYIAMLQRDGEERLTEVRLSNSILSQQLEKLKLEVELMRRQMSV